MKTLICGRGQIGIALERVLSTSHYTWLKDKEQLDLTNVEILHICYPYSEKFIEITKDYIKKYKPKYTIIHSTVPVGITRQCGENVFHSPVRGIHPDLEEGLRTFVKYLAPPNQELKEYFNRAGIKIMEVEKPEITELGKLLDTTYYGLCIAYHAYANKLCEKLDLPFTVVMDDFNKTYNEGYLKLGKRNVIRPILYPPPYDKMGGHCIIENSELLKKQFGDDLILRSILRHKK